MPEEISISHLNRLYEEDGCLSYTVLNEAVSYDRRDVVDALLTRQDLNLDHTGGDGMTALMWAAAMPRSEPAQRLLELGADIHLTENTGGTALIVAALNGRARTVELLLNWGADIDHADSIGATALFWAARSGYRNIVEILTSRGADINHRTQFSRQTALIWVAREGNVEGVRALLDAGADANQQASDGQTALMNAADRGHIEIVRALLEREDININQQNWRGETAFVLAQRNGHQEIVDLIRERLVAEQGVVSELISYIGYRDHEHGGDESDGTFSKKRSFCSRLLSFFGRAVCRSSKHSGEKSSGKGNSASSEIKEGMMSVSSKKPNRLIDKHPTLMEVRVSSAGTQKVLTPSNPHSKRILVSPVK